MASYWRAPQNGPYGSPRGNPVMSAKRTSGPSADRTMRLAVVMERCKVEGCDRAAVAAFNRGNVAERRCMDHIGEIDTQRTLSVRAGWLPQFCRE